MSNSEPSAEPRRFDPSGLINRLADFLSTATGFLATFVALIVGILVGALVHFNNDFMLGFNLVLSVLAIVIAGIILVSGARSEAALQVKLDYLIANSEASNKTIGLEHKDVAEIEAERKAVEKEALETLDEAVEDEVTEQLNERQRAGQPGIGR